MKRIAQLVLIFALACGTVTVSVPNAEAATSLRVAAKNNALTQKGARYVYGAAGGYSKGYDCSGLVKWAYEKEGKHLPRTAAEQYNRSHHIASGHRTPGDLIFIKDRRNGHVYHVGIFTRNINGKGYMINASSGATTPHKVMEAPIAWYTAGKYNIGLIGRY